MSVVSTRVSECSQLNIFALPKGKVLTKAMLIKTWLNAPFLKKPIHLAYLAGPNPAVIIKIKELPSTCV
jgi:hypothetical protein